MRFSIAVVALSVAASANALALKFVKNVTVNITLTSVAAGTASVQFVAQNPVDFPVTLSRVSVAAGSNNTVYATFASALSLNIPASTSTTKLGLALSPVIKNVVLTKGVFGSLGLLFQPTIDIYSANLSLSAYNIPIDLNDLTQLKVPNKINLNLFSLSKREQALAKREYVGDHITYLE